MRFISGLLLLLGLAAAVYGGFRLIGEEEAQNSVAHAPAPESAEAIALEPSVAAAPLPAPVLEEAPSPEGGGAPQADIESVDIAASEDAMNEPVMTTQSAPISRADAPEPNIRGAERRQAVGAVGRSAAPASFAERL